MLQSLVQLQSLMGFRCLKDGHVSALYRLSEFSLAGDEVLTDQLLMALSGGGFSFDVHVVAERLWVFLGAVT